MTCESFEVRQPSLQELVAEADAAARAFAASIHRQTRGRWSGMWGLHSGLFYAFYQGPGSQEGICVPAATPNELLERIEEKDAELLLPAWLRSMTTPPDTSQPTDARGL
jgi:hypothetical protein